MLCLCEDTHRIATQTRLVVIMHYLEWLKTTNTGRLAFLSLAPAELHIRGLAHRPIPVRSMMESEGTTMFLYPSSAATTLTKEWVATLPRPFTLIVPDGNWRQASKVRRREKGLKPAQLVQLPVGPPSEYRLRRGPIPNGVCTLEAIARAMGILEGPEVQSHLEERFRVMVERILWSRGEVHPTECEHLPPGAWQPSTRRACRAPSKEI